MGNLSLASRAFAAGDDTIRVALIGCGGRGRGAAVAGPFHRGNVKLVAMADAFADQLDDEPRTHQETDAKETTRPSSTSPKNASSSASTPIKKVLDSDVDLVILATPPGFRPIHFEAAVDAGKHVFMEKPVATDAPGVRRVLESAASRQARRT